VFLRRPYLTPALEEIGSSGAREPCRTTLGTGFRPSRVSVRRGSRSDPGCSICVKRRAVPRPETESPRAPRPIPRSSAGPPPVTLVETENAPGQRPGKPCGFQHPKPPRLDEETGSASTSWASAFEAGTDGSPGGTVVEMLSVRGLTGICDGAVEPWAVCRTPDVRTPPDALGKLPPLDGLSPSRPRRGTIRPQASPLSITAL
jgi:hypothetical protein